MSDVLTDRQCEVLDFINRFRSREQCNRTCAEIAEHFGWASANAANEHLQALKRKGALMYRDGGSRARGYRVMSGYSEVVFS